MSIENNAKYNELGLELYNQANYADAAIYFKQVIKNNPNDFDANFNLGVTYAALKDKLQSLNYYLAAYKINPNDRDCVANLTFGLKEQSMLDEAILILNAYRIENEHDYEIQNFYEDLIKIDNENKKIINTIEKSKLTLKKSYDLLTGSRFDIPAKYIYAKYRVKKIQSDWHIKLYKEHLAVWNNFKECGRYTGQEKETPETFISTFNSLIDSVKTKGFDSNVSRLWVNADSKLINGGHRLAASILFDKDVSCEVHADYEGQLDCSWEYFKNKRDFIPTGLSIEAGDATALEYVRLKKNTYIVTVFPRAIGFDQEIRDILNQSATIVYDKQLTFKKNGLFNLIKTFYEDEFWVGDYADSFAGIRAKTDLCSSPYNDNVRIYLIETDLRDQLSAVKDKIRSLFKIDKHSVHINDSYDETVRIAEAVFNSNSLHFLENADIKFMENFNSLFESYHARLKCENGEDYCITGDAIQAVYGIKDTDKIEFIHHKETVNFWMKNITCVNQTDYQRIANDEIIFNPEYHFYYRGCKFMAINNLHKMV